LSFDFSSESNLNKNIKMPNKKILSRTNSEIPASIAGSKSNESFDALDEEELLVEESEISDDIEGDENRSKVCVAR
jgi:hypothetical protein